MLFVLFSKPLLQQWRGKADKESLSFLCNACYSRAELHMLSVLVSHRITSGSYCLTGTYFCFQQKDWPKDTGVG